MAQITGAHHTSFTIADLDKSLTFFRDVMGLEVVFTRDLNADYFGQIVGHPGAWVKAALLRIPNSSHHIELFQYLIPMGTPVDPRPCDPGSSHLALLTDDLPALHATLSERGAKFASPPVEITAGPNRGAYAVYLRDPNGILIEFFQPPQQG